mgnify:CR=1 FL=1
MTNDIFNNTLLVSLPTSDLQHHHNLIDQQLQFVAASTVAKNWQTEEITISDEIIFIIDKK